MHIRNLATGLLLAAAAKPGFALSVNSPGDNGPGNCNTTCTLRDAISSAVAGAAIDFALGPAAQTIALTGVLNIDRALTIVGPGAGLLTIKATSSRVFEIGAATTISGLAIADGDPYHHDGHDDPFDADPGSDTVGGCILTLAGAPLVLTNVSLVNCQANGGDSGSSNATHYGAPGGSAAGGAIYASGPLTLINSSITGSQVHGGHGARGSYVGGDGGSARGCAIYAAGDSVTIRGSTIAGCSASGGMGGEGTFCGSPSFRAGAGGNVRGGSLYSASGTAAVGFSTLSGNVLTPGPGGIRLYGCAPGVDGSAAGDGIFAGVTTTITSSVIATEGSHSECAGAIVAAGANFDQHGTCAGFSLHGTMTHNFRPLTQASDGLWSYFPRNGAVVDAALACDPGRTLDLHGSPLPIGPHCDLGAVEADYTSYVFGDSFE